MKVYLAAQYSRREELKQYVADLDAIGIASTARWVTETAPMAVGGATGTSNTDPSHVADLALRDLQDIDNCDILLLFTNGAATQIVRGAHHFESGYAYGRGKWVFTVGPRDNVFHYLPSIFNFATWEEAREYLKLERVREEATLGY